MSKRNDIVTYMDNRDNKLPSKGISGGINKSKQQEIKTLDQKCGQTINNFFPN